MENERTKEAFVVDCFNVFFERQDAINENDHSVPSDISKTIDLSGFSLFRAIHDNDRESFVTSLCGVRFT